MESKKKVRKVARPSSDSSSDSDSSSSSSSEETRRKQKHRNIRKQQRESSSSSEEETVRKSHKHASHKKSSSARKHSHAAKIRTKLVLSSGKKSTRSMSPASRAAHKHHLKAKMAAKKLKLAQLEEHERRSRTPTRRDVKKDRTPDHRMTSPPARIRVSVPNNRAVRDRSGGRGIKDSPSTSRRHVREPASEKERAEILVRCQERQRGERERLQRLQEEEERYKHAVPRSADRSTRIIDTKHHHDRSRSQSRGKIPIRERLDKEYDYRRSISREHEDYPVMRPTRDPAYGRERPVIREEPERNFDYRGGDERRLGNHEFGPSSRNYEDRPHRGPTWENDRDLEPRNTRPYENRDWDQPKRIPEDFKDQRDRSWNDDKWSKNWKESSSSDRHHGAPPSSGPTMPHPRRWQGPSETWTPRSSHKMDSGPSSGPPFKPRFSGGSSSHFGGFNKRFPFKRFPNQYSKINYPSKRILPSTPLGSGQSRTPVKMSENSRDSPMKSDIEQLPVTPGKVEPTESGEITTEPEEDKVEADTTTFSGNVETQSQEECEGNLSEFSDVDDEILNREEELARGAAAELNASTENQNGDDHAQKIISKIHANNELKKEMDLDFEEISDGELEEESRIKGLGDALGVDWASLAKETQRPIKHDSDEFIDSTKLRWTPHRILWDIGVSTKLAGEDFARQVLTEARDELRREKLERREKLQQLKSEKMEMTNGVKEENEDGVKVKIEPKEEDEEIKTEPEIFEPEDDLDVDGDVLIHPLAQVQVLMRKLQTKRKNLILHSTGKYGRALSARRDLKIRRQLCNLPTRDIKIDRNCIASDQLNKNIDAIYQKLVGEVS